MEETLLYKSGDEYGNVVLTGKSYTKPTKNGSKRYVEFICDCDKIAWTRFDGLKSGHCISCGCHHIKQITTQKGLSRHSLRAVWGGLIRRCYDIRCIYYKNYGGRGVTVCEEWKDDYQEFYNWAISNGWRKGLELDKDKLAPTQTGKIYSPEFCSFITHQENTLHTSTARMVEYKGLTKNLSVWCEELGLEYNRMNQRLRNLKWSAKKAFETPIRKIKIS